MTKGYGNAWLLVTGGGHIDFSSGLETVINAGRQRGKKILAPESGWRGVSIPKPIVYDITDYPVENLKHFGGSFIGSSRTNPKDLQLTADNIRKYGDIVVIAFGGEDTLGVAFKLYQGYGIPIVGWPKTMDNDMQGNHCTIGYITAVYRAAQATREAFDNAFTHSKIVVLPVFGRKFDWVSAGAADYGFADYVIPAERKNFTLTQVANDIGEKVRENKERYGRPFAVVVVSEAADELKGLEAFIQKYIPVRGKDDFGHVELKPEALALALEDALSEYLGVKGAIARKVLTYHLRDGKLDKLDEVFARMTAAECVRLIDREDFGRVATIQNPDLCECWPDDSSAWVSPHGRPLFVSSVPLELAAKVRPVKGTPFFDYDKLRPTEQMSAYLSTMLGPKSVNPRDMVVPLKLAIQVAGRMMPASTTYVGSQPSQQAL
ncbi:6-phosphofructokinase [Candidatus Woesearchaeota archaeon]|nr:6-phosphofructokinase [Candidatus Woesearchaeota archaeon]